jgi:hypothetical protein
MTLDGGASWTDIKNGLPYTQASMTSLAVDYENSHKLWVTFSGYVATAKVYVTTNAGASWTNISDGLPNVPVNCVVHQAGCEEEGAIYVGTDIGVFYTNDSLQATATKWISYNNNLPNVVVSELEIHYGAQVVRAATYGRGIWETPLYAPSDFSRIQEYNDNGLNLTLFPNPVKNELNITANLTGENHVQITVFSLNGKKLFVSDEMTNDGLNKNINLQQLSAGAYMIQVNINDAIYSTRFIKE